MGQLEGAMFPVTGILLILLDLGKGWKPFAWLTPGGLVGRISVLVSIADIVLAVVALRQFQP